MALSPEEVFREQLETWKKRRGLSDELLAQRLRSLGFSINGRTLNRILREGRKVSLDEALAIAGALDVPPPVMFFGLGTERRVAITEKWKEHPDLLTRWLAGEVPLGREETLAESAWREAHEPLRLHGELRTAQATVREADKELRRAEYVGDKKRLTKARNRRVEALKRLADALREMQMAAYSDGSRVVQHPPRMPEWEEDIEEMKRLDLLEGD